MLMVAWNLVHAMRRSRSQVDRHVRHILGRLDWDQLDTDPTGRSLREQLLDGMSRKIGRRRREAFREAALNAIALDEMRLLPQRQQELLSGVMRDRMDLASAARRSNIELDEAIAEIRSTLRAIERRVASAGAALDPSGSRPRRS
ncbi:hypothetical protein CFN78_16900 [Amycolatopsis antarctica]|uniref:Uncharacterized protein n=2 Tax=Amycolatopsis antarctica TaxID=1854586 RepID=A0A263D1H9_9PSEU|nr:hypothetical protein CFN78_16900 [Amycolatopsis antarctica]